MVVESSRSGNAVTDQPIVDSGLDFRRFGMPDKEFVEAARAIEIREGRPLVPDTSGDWPVVLDDEHLASLIAKHEFLGAKDLRPIELTAARRPAPDWNSVALFFNLPSGRRPDDYHATSAADVLAWLDEGPAPASPKITNFVQDYWRAVSYGHLNFGVAVPRNGAGRPLVPTVDAGAQDWVELAKRCLEAHPEAIWRAAGGLTKEGRRWLPSLVVVQHYETHASAWFGGWTQTIGGHEYEVGDITHVRYDLSFAVIGPTTTTTRTFWGTLTHEFGHNFLEFGDLYGPQGCTGYWDLLGDNSPPTAMSEISSLFKQRVRWLDWKQIVNGPHVARTSMSLRPYSSSGEAIKVVPDPEHTPDEYFLLEFRKSLGREAWRPDGALRERGLLITHINDRLGVPSTWLLREAPYFDPEFADYTDRGSSLWTGFNRLDGVLFPHGSRSFTNGSQPNSRLYGNRASGLSITNIRVEAGECRFDLEINGSPRVGWTVSPRDQLLAGDFVGDASSVGEQIVIRNDDALALVVEQEAQYVVVAGESDWVGDWNLGGDDRALVADLDGDGKDEIFIRSPDWAGVLGWRGSRFTSLAVQNDWIGEWNLGTDNWELTGDFDGDGRDEVYVRSPDWAGVLALRDGVLTSLSVQHDWIGQWNLGPDNKEYVGRFSRADRDQVLLVSPDWLGLATWKAGGFSARTPQHDWLDGWNLGSDNWHVVGDFDGDGLDEVYARSPHWAGVWKWRDGAFRVLWMTETPIRHLTAGEPQHQLALMAGDNSVACRLLPDRDGIVHVGAGGRLAALTWEDGAMRMRHYLDSPVEGRWPLAASDRVAAGRFQRTGMDRGDPSIDFVSDSTGSAFIVGASGTAAVGANFIDNPSGDDLWQFGLTWKSGRDLMTATRVQDMKFKPRIEKGSREV